MKVVKLYKSQNASHHQIISANGFGSFLGIKCSKLHPDLSNYLMGSFNHESCSLDFPSRGSIPITDEVVKKVLGLPLGKYPALYTVDSEATSFVMNTLGFGNGKQPKLTDVEAKLKAMVKGDDLYFMTWVMYVVCSVLAPTTGIRVCPKCYPAIMDPSKIKDLNWCRFVITVLIETAKAKGVKNPFKPCMAFLEVSIFNFCTINLYYMLHLFLFFHLLLFDMQILYIDSLDTEDVNVSQDGPRICAWDNKSATQAIEQDLNNDGSFGRLPVSYFEDFMHFYFFFYPVHF
jgi:hypothetical protein